MFYKIATVTLFLCWSAAINYFWVLLRRFITSRPPGRQSVRLIMIIPSLCALDSFRLSPISCVSLPSSEMSVIPCSLLWLFFASYLTIFPACLLLSMASSYNHPWSLWPLFSSVRVWSTWLLLINGLGFMNGRRGQYKHFVPLLSLLAQLELLDWTCTR